MCLVVTVRFWRDGSTNLSDVVVKVEEVVEVVLTDIRLSL